MTDPLPVTLAPPLELLPYHRRIVEFLQRHDPEVWKWFATPGKRDRQAEELKFDLLKSTYRIDRDSRTELYAAAEQVAQQLGLSAPITIYQAQDPAGLNASLAYLPGEIHVVLHGPITTQLSPLEVKGLLGHELTHFLLWERWNGDLRIAGEMLAALTHDSRAQPAHFSSWRLLTLYTEILCDRGALAVCEDLRAVVSMLVKVQTGVQEINADSYLKQAGEIFARGSSRTEGVSHPEAFIRARALQLWADHDPTADDKIAEMIEAGTDLKELDLVGQERMAGWTRRLIDLLLARKWFQTDLVLAHARLYFDDYAPPADALVDAGLAGEVRQETKSVHDYFCFVLLDFVSADRDLDAPSLAAALEVAEQLDIKERFIELARQELRLRKNQLEKADKDKATLLREADKAASL